MSWALATLIVLILFSPLAVWHSKPRTRAVVGLVLGIFGVGVCLLLFGVESRIAIATSGLVGDAHDLFAQGVASLSRRIWVERGLACAVIIALTALAMIGQKRAK